MFIDHVLVNTGSGHNLITTNEWVKMSLPERIEIINDDGVEFLSGDEPVGIEDALRAIKAAHGE